MIKEFFTRFKDDRKYFTIVFFIFIMLILSGIVSPKIIKYQTQNWASKLPEKISIIEQNTIKKFKELENQLLSTSVILKGELRKALSANDSYGRLVKIINNEKFNQYSLEILAPNGNLVAWNSMIAVPQDKIFPFSYPLGETYFFKSDLITFLTLLDTIESDSDVFYLVCSLPFEKHYQLKNEYYQQISFSKTIADQNSVQVDVDLNPFAAKTTDGRKYSFDLLNNKNNKIGQVTITKPILDVELNKTNHITEVIQSVLVFLGILFLGFGLKKDYVRLQNPFYKIFLFGFYLAAFRYLIYKVNFPANILNGELTDPSYFSSAFAGGLVRSPIEFFITALFFTILSLKVYQEFFEIIVSDKFQKFVSNRSYWLLLILPTTLIFFLGLRGLAAILRSIIFDSTIRYFRDTLLLPDFPVLLMNLNVLLCGFSIVLLLSLLLIFQTALIDLIRKKQSKKYFLFLFLFIQLSGAAFIIAQDEPLINLIQVVLFTLLIYLLSAYIYFKIRWSKYSFVYAAIIGSIVSILQLNHFNVELERESLKTIAAEINRPSDNLYKFIISDLLLSNYKSEHLISLLINKTSNFNSEAFILWNQSPLQREVVNSSVKFLDSKGNVLGQFYLHSEIVDEDIPSIIALVKNDPIVYESRSSKNSDQKLLTGIAPIFNEKDKIGYIAASMQWETNFPFLTSIPDFIQSKKTSFNSVVDFSRVKIFEFKDSKLVRVIGDIYPSRDQILPIINYNFAQSNDGWISLNLNEEKYIAYLLKHDSEEETNITSVLLLEPQYSINIFNFFKLFIIHILFVFIFFAVLFLKDVKNIRYTFRFRLTVAFLLIALIPVVLLAFYNRQIVDKRIDEAIFNDLNQRAFYIENNIQTKLKLDKNANLKNIFAETAKNLGISFSVFYNSDLIYNSNEQYYSAGLFMKRINPQVYYSLNYLSYREYLSKEQFENFSFNSFYKKILLNDKAYVLQVNDMFNKVKLSLSTTDLDVLLFGIYLLAAFIIILISALMANKISEPIRRLTRATLSVAQGDLNVNIENKEKGELKNLLDGFNMMTNELKRNQTELAELERESAWKEMAKQVAHEIKNPLTPMKLSIQQLIASFKDKNKNFEEIFEKVSNTILNQIESLSSIASEFSRFAKMPSFKIEKVDLATVSKDVMNLFIDEKISISLEVNENTPQVNADSSHVRRILINMVRNSIQAGADKIILKIFSDDENCFLIIEDNGRGVPFEIRDKIFEQNFTTKSTGMGLGLKLAKRFLDGIGGEIKLLESTTAGTTFQITFPITKN